MKQYNINTTMINQLFWYNAEPTYLFIVFIIIKMYI